MPSRLIPDQTITVPPPAAIEATLTEISALIAAEAELRRRLRRLGAIVHLTLELENERA